MSAQKEEFFFSWCTKILYVWGRNTECRQGAVCWVLLMRALSPLDTNAIQWISTQRLISVYLGMFRANVFMCFPCVYRWAGQLTSESVDSYPSFTCSPRFPLALITELPSHSRSLWLPWHGCNYKGIPAVFLEQYLHLFANTFYCFSMVGGFNFQSSIQGPWWSLYTSLWVIIWV